MLRIVLGFLFSSVIVACAPTRSLEVRARYQDSLQQNHRFIPLEDGRLYSGAEPSDAMLRWLIEERGVKTFVSLKGAMSAERLSFLASRGVTVHSVAWSASRVPPEEELLRVFTLMQESSRENPVYVYCRAGVDRTGYARAYYRYFAQGWSAKDSLGEMYSLFHLPNVLDKDLKQKFSQSKDPR